MPVRVQERVDLGSLAAEFRLKAKLRGWLCGGRLDDSTVDRLGTRWACEILIYGRGDPA